MYVFAKGWAPLEVLLRKTCLRMGFGKLILGGAWGALYIFAKGWAPLEVLLRKTCLRMGFSKLILGGT